MRAYVAIHKVTKQPWKGKKVIFIDAGADDQSIQELFSSHFKQNGVNDEFHSLRLYYFLKK